ncbi:MAG: Ig-like domain-containing protein [Planctomycetia bacterium]|nr:Ig-like domain-containing protein [Planctomycetia bacterium]
MKSIKALLVCAVLLTLCQTGCGEKTSCVSGVVTLDGQPLPDHRVSFTLETNGVTTGATGLTDANGKYTLTTESGKTGCPIGHFQVRLGWVNPNPPKNVLNGDPSPYKLPKSAFDGSTTFEVSASGSSEANFDFHTDSI